MKMFPKTKVCDATREPQSLEAETKVNEAAASVDVLKKDFSSNRMSLFLWEKSENPPFLFREENRVSSHPRGRLGVRREEEGGGGGGFSVELVLATCSVRKSENPA